MQPIDSLFGDKLFSWKRKKNELIFFNRHDFDRIFME